MNDYNSHDDTLAPDSRYYRPRLSRMVSWTGLVLGLLMGMVVGLVYTWTVNPLQLEDIHPHQLEPSARASYIAAIALSFAYNPNLEQATDRLLAAVPGGRDPFQEMADVACTLAQSGYVSSSSGIKAVSAMKTFYQLQGRTGCADDLLLVANAPTPVVTVVLPTPTPMPPPTKTPTIAPTSLPTNTPLPIFVPTAPPLETYILINVITFCDVTRSGIIEAFVQDFNGAGIPGQPVRVRWENGEDVFYTGLKPERSPGYADFTMEANVAYTIDMPQRSEPSNRELVAAACTTENGDRAITSYRVVFRPAS